MSDRDPGGEPARATTASLSGAVGSLVIVATPIGNVGDIAPRALEVLSSADFVCCEDTRHSGQLLKRLGVRAQRLVSLHAHNESERAIEIVGRIRDGATVALISDAGTPLISDPGERVVASVLAAGFPVTTVPGPSAAVAGLTLSGLPIDRWCFEGFLPRKGKERKERLEEIAGSAMARVVYESPLRVEQTLRDLLEYCAPTRQVVIARELTKLHEEVWRGTLADAVQRDPHIQRGEYVLVVGPIEQVVTGDDTLRATLGQLFDAGLGRKDAVAAVEVMLGGPHRVAYQMALEIGPTNK